MGFSPTTMFHAPTSKTIQPIRPRFNPIPPAPACGFPKPVFPLCSRSRKPKHGAGENIQTVCKPGSVHIFNDAGRPFLWDGPCGPPQRDQPGRRVENTPALMPSGTAPAAPIRSCSRWGLPCQPCHQGRGALLPHRFTLAPASRGGLFSVALSLGSPPPAVSRHRISVEPGLSSSGLPRQRPPNRLDARSLALFHACPSTSARTAAARRRVGSSASPLSHAGIKCRWKARITSRAARRVS